MTTLPERLQDVIAEMREWANGEGCFNDDPDGEPLPCVYYSQQAFLKLCDRLEAAQSLQAQEGVDFRDAVFELVFDGNAINDAIPDNQRKWVTSTGVSVVLDLIASIARQRIAAAPSPTAALQAGEV